MIIYLARHGETTGDIENRYGGDYDDHLTDRGQKQSAELAKQLAPKRIQKLYVSPLARAQETGGFIAGKLGLTTKVVPAFKERNSYGILTGLTKTEALGKYPEQVGLVKDFHNAAEGAEGYEQFKVRVINALNKLSSEPYERVAVITHGGPLKVIFREVLKAGEIDVADCAFVALEASEQSYHLIEQNGIKVL